MGFLDALLGKRKLKGPATDRLFAISTAYVGLDAQQGITTRGVAGIVFQPLATGDFRQIVDDMQEILSGTGSEMGSSVETKDDEFGYRWMIVRDPDIEDVAVGVNAVNDALAVYVISFFLMQALSRYREFAADRGAAIITGRPSALSSALMKISGTMERIPQTDLRAHAEMNAFYIVPAGVKQSVYNLFSTHPPMEKRIEALSRLEAQLQGAPA